jgi:hypothetical protein
MTNRFGIYLCRGNCRGEEVVGKAIGLSWRSLIAADRVLPMLLVRQGEALAAGHLGMELCLGPRRNCFPLTGGTEGSNPSSSSGESLATAFAPPVQILDCGRKLAADRAADAARLQHHHRLVDAL